MCMIELSDFVRTVIDRLCSTMLKIMNPSLRTFLYRSLATKLPNVRSPLNTVPLKKIDPIEINFDLMN